MSKRYWAVADQAAGAIAARPLLLRIIVRTLLVMSVLQLLAGLAILAQAVRVETGSAQAWAITPQGVRVMLDTYESAEALRAAKAERLAAGGPKR